MQTKPLLMVENTQYTESIIGWDIGGARLKAVRLSTTGLEIAQEAFAMWQNRDELATSLANIAATLEPALQAAITITAELSDAFRTKREGISYILKAVQEAMPNRETYVFGIDGQFHTLETARHHPMMVTAANWLATAMLIAKHLPDGLLVDIGSTTTDIIPFLDGQVIAQGVGDPERLIRGELVYTGVLRTPICAMVRHVPLRGQWCPVAAEWFATAQDVHLLLGNLTPEQCTSPSADGRPMTPEFAAERLARVVCADTEILGRDAITAIAQYIGNEQIRQVTEAIAQVVSRVHLRGPVVAVGAGAFLVQAAAKNLGLQCLLPADVVGQIGLEVTPAAAVAYLLQAGDNFG